MNAAIGVAGLLVLLAAAVRAGWRLSEENQRIHRVLDGERDR